MQEVKRWIRVATQVLVDLEWYGWDGMSWECPLCREGRNGKKHSPDCRIGWLLGARTKGTSMSDLPEVKCPPKPEPCLHEKVYSNRILASMPPQTPWICRLCGETGIDQEKLAMPKESYDDLMVKFHGRVEAVRRGVLQPGVFEVGDSPAAEEASDKTS